MVGKEIVLPEGVWEGFWKEGGIGTGKFGSRMGSRYRKQQWALSQVCLGRVTRLMQLQQERGLGKEIGAKFWKTGFNFRCVLSAY